MSEPVANRQPRFEHGRIVSTHGALAAVSPELMQRCLTRHLTGDWGCIGDADKEANEEALRQGLRILSAYPIDPARPAEGFGDNTLWIITEADRSVTTFLLPEEY